MSSSNTPSANKNVPSALPPADEQQMNQAYAALVANFSESEILAILPTGLRTPKAAICRLAAYMGTIPSNPAEIVQMCVQYRNNPDFAKGAGHKRSAWIALVAIVVHANASRNIRPTSAKMLAMITDAFPREWVRELVYLLCQPTTKSLDWKKDGVAKVIKVPAAVADDKEVVDWAAAPWGTAQSGP